MNTHPFCGVLIQQGYNTQFRQYASQMDGSVNRQHFSSIGLYVNGADSFSLCSSFLEFTGITFNSSNFRQGKSYETTEAANGRYGTALPENCPPYWETYPELCRLEVGKMRFSTEIAVYLGNGTRQSHGCYGTLIGNHRWWIDTCPFR